MFNDYDMLTPYRPFLSRPAALAGKLIGIIVHSLDTRYKRIVRRNLRFAYPDMAPREVCRMSRQVYQQFGLTLVELLKLAFISRDELLGMVEIRGGSHIDKAVKDGSGFIFYSAHIGNWEIAHLFTSVYINMDLVLVAKALRFSRIDRLVNRMRSRFGNQIIYKKGALLYMARALRNKRGVGLLIDQETKVSESVEVTFFGKTVYSTPSAALLARRYGCPVLPVFCVREENRGRLVLVVRSPLALVKTRDPESDVVVNTQKMTDEIEAIVRAYPSQWFWFHKRWKRHYPHLYPEDIARNERRERKKRAHSRRV